MKIKFKTNLGSMDAKAHGALDHTKCMKGMELDVEETVGKWMIDQNIAEPAGQFGVSQPSSVLGVPHDPTKPKAKDATDAK